MSKKNNFFLSFEEELPEYYMLHVIMSKKKLPEYHMLHVIMSMLHVIMSKKIKFFFLSKKNYPNII